MPTKAALLARCREAYSALMAISPEAAVEACTQAGLPEVFWWHGLTCAQIGALSVALRIRLLEAS